jgi:hypothetical protein
VLRKSTDGVLTAGHADHMAITTPLDVMTLEMYTDMVCRPSIFDVFRRLNKPLIRKKSNDLLGRWLVHTPTFTMICYGIRHACAAARSLSKHGLEAQIG